jgi:molecular chaperone IbpA
LVVLALFCIASIGGYMMNSIDLSPLYRNSIGFDRLATLLDSAFSTETASVAYPPYDIEVLEENRYTISLAVAGFEQEELDLSVEKGVLCVSGKKQGVGEHKFLHHGIAHRTFERKFNLADYVEVVDAELRNGLLIIHLVKEIPEAMKPRTSPISKSQDFLEHEPSQTTKAEEQEVA